MAKETLNLVRDYILDGLKSGAFGKGHKLPAERTLAENLGTTRATVRQALIVLESEKRVTRHVGRGTFVVDDYGWSPVDRIADETSGDREAQLPRIDASPSQFMQARQLLEPQLAELVVVNATESDLIRIRQIVEAQRDLEGDEFEQSDIEFHTTLARAARNEVLLATARLFNTVRQDPEWRKLKAAVRAKNGGRREEAVSEHLEVAEALQARDAARAVRAMRAHLNSVRFNLLGH